MGATSPLLTEELFWFGDDDGTDETDNTFLGIKNSNQTLLTDKSYRYRTSVSNTGDKDGSGIQLQLEYNLLGAGWNPVNASSSVVIMAASTKLTEGNNCSERLAGAQTFDGTNGGQEDGDGLTGTAVDLLQANEIEADFCFSIVSGDVADTNTIVLRVTDAGSPLDGYPQTPTITVSEGTPITITVTAFALAGSLGATTVLNPKVVTASVLAIAGAIGSVSVFTPVGILLDIDHEIDLTEWDGTTGSPTRAAAAAMGGTSWGLSVPVSGSTNVYGFSAIDVSSVTVCRFRFYFDPNSYSIDSAGDTHNIVEIRANIIASALRVDVDYDVTYGQKIRVDLYDDSNVRDQTAYADLTDGPHWIEVKITRATNSTSSDGAATMWIDDVLHGSVTAVDNFDVFPDMDEVRLGMINQNTTTSGTIYIDQLIFRDDGTYIGPVISAKIISVGEFALVGAIGNATVFVLAPKIISVAEFALVGAFVSSVVVHPEIVVVNTFALIGALGSVAITNPKIVSVSTLAIVGAMGTTTIIRPLTIPVGTFAATLAMGNVGVTISKIVNVSTFALTGALGLVTITNPKIVSVNAFALTGALGSVSVRRPRIVPVGEFALVGALGSVVVSKAITISVNAFALTGALNTVTITNPKIVNVNVFAITVAMGTVNVSVGVPVVVNINTFALVGQLGNVTTLNPKIVFSGTLALTGALGSTAVLNPKIISVNAFALTLAMGNVTITNVATVIVPVNPFALVASLDNAIAVNPKIIATNIFAAILAMDATTVTSPGVAIPVPATTAHSPGNWHTADLRFRKLILRGIMPEEFVASDLSEIEEIITILDDL